MNLLWFSLFFFISLGGLFFSAIPPSIKPISIADLVLLSSSLLSVFYINKKGMAWAYLATVWFIFSSSIGSLRDIEASMITGALLGLKWVGALTLYFFLSRNTQSTLMAVKMLSFVHIIILVSLITGIRPFSDSYYSGFNGVFQASADGGFYLLCSIGFFLELQKSDPSKFNALNLIVSSLALLMVDSRYGVLLAALVILYHLLGISNGRFAAFALSMIVLTGFYSGVLQLPSKIQFLLSEISNPIALIGNDVSMLIRVNNFVNAFEFTSFFGFLVGNGGKFFQLNSFQFFEDNYSLDNSYAYILLSFGVPGLIFLFKFLLSRDGLNILGRGSLTFLILAYVLMQDAFSNSFSLIALSLFLSVHTATLKKVPHFGD
jgi:hypothetical protein